MTDRQLFLEERDAALEGTAPADHLPAPGAPVSRPHSLFGGISWWVTPSGIRVAGEADVERTRGEPRSMRLYLASWGDIIAAAAEESRVPVALLLMTIATENGAARIEGQRLVYPAVRKEPGFVSDAATPHRISFAPCHVLLSTARAALGEPNLSSAQAANPTTNIRAAAHYIAGQRKKTGYDPILVAAAYNAGAIYDASSSSRYASRWHIRAWPGHLDRAAAWYGDACAVLREHERVAQLDDSGLGRVIT